MKKQLLSCFCCIEALARRPETAVYKQLVGLALAERCSHTLSSCLFENCHLVFPALDDFQWKIAEPVLSSSVSVRSMGFFAS